MILPMNLKLMAVGGRAVGKIGAVAAAAAAANADTLLVGAAVIADQMNTA